MKYHPEESVKRKDEQKSALNKRVDVFNEFRKTEMFKGLAIDAEQQDALVKLLDSVVIFLEGGNENDLKVMLPFS